MLALFWCCSSLLSLPDISVWKTNDVESMSWMFYDCSSLSSLPDISKWNVENLLDAIYINGNLKMKILIRLECLVDLLIFHFYQIFLI